MPRKFYKIQESEVNGKNYFGLFVSTKDELPCDFETFIRGWELEKFNKLSESDRDDYKKELQFEVSGSDYSPSN